MAQSSQDHQRFVSDLGHSRRVTSITGSWRSDDGVAGQAGCPAQLDLVAGVGVAVVQRRLGPAPQPPPPRPSGRCHPQPSRSAAGADPPLPAAIQAANEATAKLPKDRRPAPLPGRLRFYDLRHTCASLLIAQGASVKAVQAQLGHATASITLDTYGHLFPSEMDTLGDRLELVRDAAGTDPARTSGQRPGRNHRSGAVAEAEGSNPVRCRFAVRGRGNEWRVTFDSCSPRMIARARREPAASDAIRSQRGPEPSCHLGWRVLRWPQQRPRRSGPRAWSMRVGRPYENGGRFGISQPRGGRSTRHPKEKGG